MKARIAILAAIALLVYACYEEASLCLSSQAGSDTCVFCGEDCQ